jgi:hypothetical protein
MYLLGYGKYSIGSVCCQYYYLQFLLLVLQTYMCLYEIYVLNNFTLLKYHKFYIR